MEYEDIIYEAKDGIARITINRPQVLNAFRERTVDELLRAFEAADSDGTVGVVVLSGAGGKAFCAGGDVETMSYLTPEYGGIWQKKLLRLASTIRNLGKPVIAAINGFCIGGGNELNLFCDLSIATEKSRFAQVGPMVGSVPVWGATQLLPRAIGEKKAREMVFLCQQYDAHEAQRMGLVNKVVPEEKFEEEVNAWCQRILDMSPLMLRLAKISLNFESDLLYPSFIHGGELLRQVFGSEQAREGLGAFRERRKADFRRFRRKIKPGKGGQ